MPCNLQTLALDSIEIDEGIQSRVSMNADTVREYLEALQRGDELPPPVVFCDGERFWLADGFHRVAAHEANGSGTVAVEVRDGGRRDAILYAVGANARHGLPRTRADKRKAVETLLRDGEWTNLSSRAIAEHARVSKTMVDEWAAEWGIERPKDREYVRNGRTQTMDTSKMRRPESAPTGRLSGEEAAARPPATIPMPTMAEIPARQQTPVVIRDRAGIPIEGDQAEEYLAVAEACRAMEEAARRLGESIDAVAGAEGRGGVHLARRCTRRSKSEGEKARYASQHLDALKRDLRDSVPWSTRCPYCHAKGRVDPACAACRGTDWCCRASWDAAPDDVKEAVLMAHAATPEAA